MRKPMKHKKKAIGAAGVSIMGTLLVLLGLWSDIYPVICPYVSNPERCVAVSKALKEVEKTLDHATLDSGVVLE